MTFDVGDIEVAKEIRVGIPEHATFITFGEDQQNQFFQEWLSIFGFEQFREWYDEIIDNR